MKLLAVDTNPLLDCVYMINMWMKEQMCTCAMLRMEIWDMWKFSQVLYVK